MTNDDFNDNFPDYHDNLATAHDMGVRLAHVFNRDSGTPYGGVTLAYRQLAPGSKSPIFQVTAVYCSPTDVFSKRVGAAMALEAFLNDQHTNFRLPKDAMDHPGYALKNVFASGLVYDEVIE